VYSPHSRLGWNRRARGGDELKTENFLRGRRGIQLAVPERQALELGLSEPRLAPARQTLIRRGENVSQSTLLVAGYVGRYMEDREGERQLVALHLPGDFVDLHAFPLQHLDHDVVAISDVAVATISHAALTAITAELPHLTRMLWFSTLLDAAMHREWIFRLGRLDGPGRVAHLMCETALRLAAIGIGDGREFPLPINQGDIAAACGLTNVHVSRVLKSLRDTNLLAVQGNQVTLLDPAALRRIGEFDPQYLYLHDGVSTP